VVNELLDLARIEARGAADFGAGPPTWPDCCAPGGGRPCADGRQAPQLEGADTASAPVLVRVDAAKTARVLGNLLSNAYKYSPPHSAVELRLVRDDAARQAGFELQDHGIGMTPEQLARVGERFYRADPAAMCRARAGRGVVREILALMGGRLELHGAAQGTGTRTTVWLPLASPGRAAPAAAAAAAAAVDQTTLATIAATLGPMPTGMRLSAGLPREHAEQLVGKAVADVADAAEVQLGLHEVAQARPRCLASARVQRDARRADQVHRRAGAFEAVAAAAGAVGAQHASSVRGVSSAMAM